MIDHLSTYAIDYPTTRAFYDVVLPAVGAARVAEFVATWDTDFPERRMAGFGPGAAAVLWVIETKTVPTPRHVAFSAASRAQVDAFHAAAIATGALDDGPPGLRPHYGANYYAAFVLDPDGNNIEAVFHGEARRSAASVEIRF